MEVSSHKITDGGMTLIQTLYVKAVSNIFLKQHVVWYLPPKGKLHLLILYVKYVYYAIC